MAVEVGGGMFNKRNRWVAVAIMAVATLAFAGVYVIVPFAEVFQGSRQSSATPTVSPSAQADLDAQARGYELVLQREPENQTALQGLVEVRLQQGNLQATVEPLEKLAQLNPDQPNYTVLLAQVKQRLGDREGAAEAYRGILKTQPGDLNALQGFVDLQLQQQRPEAAIGLLEDTLNMADEVNQSTPGSIDVVSVQLLLGRVYAEQQRFDEAITLYDRAIQNDAQDFRPVLGKAIVLQTQGKNEEAKPLFASAAALAPDQYKDQINQLASGQPPAVSPTAPPGTPAPEAAPEAPEAPASPAPAEP